jgi:hypothetical protein
MTNVPIEITFTAKSAHSDPFHQVTLDVLFTDPAGKARRIPAFWAGGSVWKVRYASPLPGKHRWRTESVPADPGLNGITGVVDITLYKGKNPLYLHGPLRVTSDKRHLEHSDGSPFFWLGDTWWMGLSHRLHWPEEFAKLTADRKAKGFTVVQIVAGLYPDMHPFDPRGANEAGFPWEKEYARINPAYFDMADRRLKHLVENGITPCIVGAWGYFLPWMGEEKMKAHWRNLIARYGAYPVVWCAAGEANLPWYLAKGFPYDDREQVKGWTKILRYIRSADPFRRLLTIHPTGIGRLSARNATDDVSLLDIDLLQTPHGQREAVAPTIRTMRESYADNPTMPVINGEPSYEMLMDRTPAQWPRAMFWLCMVNGAAGHTYGANGIWQLNRPGDPHGASPNGTGNGYGVITWEEAMRLKGSEQVAYGKQFFESLSVHWTKLVPMPGTASWEHDPKETPPGNWIWYPEGDPKRDAPVGALYFRRSFDVKSWPGLTAKLTIAADDKFTVWLNGKELGGGANWREPMRIDVTKELKPGRNVLAVRAENVASNVTANPAGLSIFLSLVYPEADTEVETDSTWRVSKEVAEGWLGPAFDDSGWKPALVTARYGEGPWGRFADGGGRAEPQACGIGDRLRVIYMIDPGTLTVKGLRAGASYKVIWFDPVAGMRTAWGVDKSFLTSRSFISPSGDHDWVLLLERMK